MSPTLFISYSHENAESAERLRADLLARGAVVWIDLSSLSAGTPNWDTAIREGIQASDAMIYLASPAALRSKNVQGELVVAERYKKLIIPFWVDGEHWADATPLDRVVAQHIDARGTGYDRALAKLCGQLNIAVIVERDEPLDVPGGVVDDTPPLAVDMAMPPAVTAAVAALPDPTPLTATLPTAAAPIAQTPPKPDAPAKPPPPTPTHADGGVPSPGGARRPPPWRWRKQWVAALAALLALAVSGAGLLANNALNQDARERQTAATQTAIAHAARTQLAGATATAQARFPYVVAAPGYPCDPAYVSWQNGTGNLGEMECVGGKTHVTAEAGPRDSPCANYGWIDYRVISGIALPAGFTASVEVSGLAADTEAALTVEGFANDGSTDISFDLHVKQSMWSIYIGPDATPETSSNGGLATSTQHALAITLDGSHVNFAVDGHSLGDKTEPAQFRVTRVALFETANCLPGGQADFANFSLR